MLDDDLEVKRVEMENLPEGTAQIVAVATGSTNH
jgi:hypothetical protein